MKTDLFHGFALKHLMTLLKIIESENSISNQYQISCWVNMFWLELWCVVRKIILTKSIVFIQILHFRIER